MGLNAPFLLSLYTHTCVCMYTHIYTYKWRKEKLPFATVFGQFEKKGSFHMSKVPLVDGINVKLRITFFRHTIA